MNSLMLMEDDIDNTLTFFCGVFNGRAAVCLTMEANSEKAEFKIDNKQDIDALIRYLKTMKKELILTTEYLFETEQHSDMQPPEIKLVAKSIVN